MNISAAFEQKLVHLWIRSETSNPYEPWQNGDEERAIGTLSGIVPCLPVALRAGFDFQHFAMLLWSTMLLFLHDSNLLLVL